MLFDYFEFLDELRQNANPRKRNVVAKRDFRSKAESLEDEWFYKSYLNKFDAKIKFKVPDELSNDFDWNLLIKLVASSLSSFFKFEFDNSDFPELLIIVKTKEFKVTTKRSIKVNTWKRMKLTKKISELWPQQILRLYSIYILEVLNFEDFMLKDKLSALGIKMERDKKIKYFQEQVRVYRENTLKNLFEIKKQELQKILSE